MTLSKGDASDLTAMRIMALNVRAGGGKRVGDILAYLDRYDPHTFVLTEWRCGIAGDRFLAYAEAKGMQGSYLADGGTKNGIFVASKSRFDYESATPNADGSGVLLHTRFEGFNLLACYFSMAKRKAPFFARCGEIAATSSAVPLLIIGDLNTGNQNMDRTEGGGRYFCSLEFDDLSAQHNLHDLWRRSNGATAREWTWLSHRDNGFRIDHAFANDALIRLYNPRCHYDHAPRTCRITDHSAVFVMAAPVTTPSCVLGAGFKPTIAG